MIDETRSHSAAAPSYLGQLSALAARSFDSTDTLMEAILALIVDQLGMRTSFLTRIDQDQARSIIIATHNESGGCEVPAGMQLQLDDTF